MTGRLVIATGIVSVAAVASTFALSPLFADTAVIPVQQKPSLSVGWVGDMVPGTEAIYNTSVFDDVRDTLSMPDLMIGNLEGTFAHADRISKCVYITASCHAFAGDPSFADALTSAGFDFVSLVNNHSYDYGDEGLADTIAQLDRVGIPYIAPTKPTASVVVHGVRVGILGLSSTPPASTITDYDFIAAEVAKLRAHNQYVIVIFHGGAEGSDKTTVPGIDEYYGDENRGNVKLVAETAIDAGADLVLGAGPHVLRPVVTYKGKTIAYSLGNFVGGKKLVMTGNLMNSGIFSIQLPDQEHTLRDVLLSKSGIPTLR